MSIEARVRVRGGAFRPDAAEAQLAKRLVCGSPPLLIGCDHGSSVAKGNHNPDASGHLRAAFKDALRELGWVENQNTVFIERYAQGDYSRFEALGSELIAQKVDVVFASLGDAAKVVGHVKPDLPIVFAASADPVGAGIVSSLARPGGNITGFSTSITRGVAPQCR